MNAFALADAAVAADEGTHAEDIDHAAVLAAARGEVEFERDGSGVDELHGDHRGAENRDAGPIGELGDARRKFRPAGDDQTGYGATEEPAQAVLAFGGGETLEVAEFGTAENLDTFRGEVIVEAREG